MCRTILLCCALFSFPALSEQQVTESLRFVSAKQSLQIELFTSQGCSSCPPAERWLNKLVHSSQLWNSLFPMAFHVDYWDDLGWPDPYAKQAFSARQRAYKLEGLSKSVYTPGLIVNGYEWRGWFIQQPLPEPQAKSGILVVNIGQSGAKVVYQTEQSSAGTWILNRAILGFGLSTYIERGENARVRLDQDFVVLDYHQYINDKSAWQIPVYPPQKRANRYAMVFWITEDGSQRPLQITGGWLPSAWFKFQQ